MHRYLTSWILTFNVDEIPKFSDQILKPFHDAPWIKKLTIISENKNPKINHYARDNFAVSVIDLVNSNSITVFEHRFTSNEAI